MFILLPPEVEAADAGGRLVVVFAVVFLFHTDGGAEGRPLEVVVIGFLVVVVALVDFVPVVEGEEGDERGGGSGVVVIVVANFAVVFFVVVPAATGFFVVVLDVAGRDLFLLLLAPPFVVVGVDGLTVVVLVVDRVEVEAIGDFVVGFCFFSVFGLAVVGFLVVVVVFFHNPLLLVVVVVAPGGFTVGFTEVGFLFATRGVTDGEMEEEEEDGADVVVVGVDFTTTEAVDFFVVGFGFGVVERIFLTVVKGRAEEEEEVVTGRLVVGGLDFDLTVVVTLVAGFLVVVVILFLLTAAGLVVVTTAAAATFVFSSFSACSFRNFSMKISHGDFLVDCTLDPFTPPPPAVAFFFLLLAAEEVEEEALRPNAAGRGDGTSSLSPSNE